MGLPALQSPWSDRVSDYRVPDPALALPSRCAFAVFLVSLLVNRILSCAWLLFRVLPLRPALSRFPIARRRCRRQRADRGWRFGAPSLGFLPHSRHQSIASARGIPPPRHLRPRRFARPRRFDSALDLAGLFHPAATSGVRSSGGFPDEKPCGLSPAAASLTFSPGDSPLEAAPCVGVRLRGLAPFVGPLLAVFLFAWTAARFPRELYLLRVCSVIPWNQLSRFPPPATFGVPGVSLE